MLLTMVNYDLYALASNKIVPTLNYERETFDFREFDYDPHGNAL